MSSLREIAIGVGHPDQVINQRNQRLQNFFKRLSPVDAQHSRSVAIKASILRDDLPVTNEEWPLFSQACLYHDIGKSAVSIRELVNAPRRLTLEELLVVREIHTAYGAVLYQEAVSSGESIPRADEQLVAALILHHDLGIGHQNNSFEGVASFLGLADLTDADVRRLATALAILDRTDAKMDNHRPEKNGQPPPAQEKVLKEINAWLHGDGEIIHQLRGVVKELSPEEVSQYRRILEAIEGNYGQLIEVRNNIMMVTNLAEILAQKNPGHPMIEAIKILEQIGGMDALQRKPDGSALRDKKNIPIPDPSKRQKMDQLIEQLKQAVEQASH